jgi:predicted RNase H-like HicB family nuclease
MKYTAIVEHVGDWYEIRVPELGDRMTQARSIEEIPDMVRSLISLFADVEIKVVEAA